MVTKLVHEQVGAFSGRVSASGRRRRAVHRPLAGDRRREDAEARAAAGYRGLVHRVLGGGAAGAPVLREPDQEGAVTFIDFLRSTFPEFMQDSWKPWRCVLALVFDVAPEDPELAFELSGLQPSEFPTKQVRRAGWVVARRAGKSRIAALVAVYFLCIKKYPKLAPGERAIFVVTAGVKGQGQSIKSYVFGFMR